MKQLARERTTPNGRYRQLCRGYKSVIYQQSQVMQERFIPVGYEVFEIQIGKGRNAIFDGKEVFHDDFEKFPNDKAFGKWAYAYTSTYGAIECFEYYEGLAKSPAHAEDIRDRHSLKPIEYKKADWGIATRLYRDIIVNYCSIFDLQPEDLSRAVQIPVGFMAHYFVNCEEPPFPELQRTVEAKLFALVLSESKTVRAQFLKKIPREYDLKALVEKLSPMLKMRPDYIADWIGGLVQEEDTALARRVRDILIRNPKAI